MKACSYIICTQRRRINPHHTDSHVVADSVASQTYNVRATESTLRGRRRIIISTCSKRYSILQNMKWWRGEEYSRTWSSGEVKKLKKMPQTIKWEKGKKKTTTKDQTVAFLCQEAEGVRDLIEFLIRWACGEAKRFIRALTSTWPLGPKAKKALWNIVFKHSLSHAHKMAPWRLSRRLTATVSEWGWHGTWSELSTLKYSLYT